MAGSGRLAKKPVAVSGSKKKKRKLRFGRVDSVVVGFTIAVY